MDSMDLQTIINDQRAQIAFQNVTIAQLNRMIVTLSEENKQLHDRCNSLSTRLSEDAIKFSSVISDKAVQEQDLQTKFDHMTGLYASLHSKYRNQLEYAGKMRLNHIALQSPLSKQWSEYDSSCDLDYDPYDPQDVKNLTLT